MNYAIAQIIGGIAFIFSLVAYHRNKKEKILGNMIISNILNLLHYILLGAYSGCITKLIAIARDSFIMIKDKRKWLSSNIFLMLFIIIYIISAICTYNSIWSIFPLLAAIIYIVPVWNGNGKIVKRTALFCYFLWLIYNIFVFSIAGIISNILSIISTFIAVKNNKKIERAKMDITYRKLNKKDNNQLKNLIENVMNSLENKDFFIPISESELNEFYDENLCIVYGAFDNEKLIAIAKLDITDKYDVKEIKEILNLRSSKVAELGRYLCTTEYRRQGIMYNLQEKLLDEAKTINMEYIVATAHPDNIASNKTLLKSKFELKETKTLSNGYYRNIYFKNI